MRYGNIQKTTWASKELSILQYSTWNYCNNNISKTHNYKWRYK